MGSIIGPYFSQVHFFTKYLRFIEKTQFLQFVVSCRTYKIHFFLSGYNARFYSQDTRWLLQKRSFFNALLPKRLFFYFSKMHSFCSQPEIPRLFLRKSYFINVTLCSFSTSSHLPQSFFLSAEIVLCQSSQIRTFSWGIILCIFGSASPGGTKSFLLNFPEYLIGYLTSSFLEKSLFWLKKSVRSWIYIKE